MDEPLTGRAIHRAWRDGMLAQGREVAPERMAWETLTQQDRDLDDGIAAALDAARAAAPPSGPEPLTPRGFSRPGEDDPRRDFMATYFDHDDDVTRGMVEDYLDRIEAAACRADRERMAQERDEMRDIILDGGLRLPGFDHWRERASSKPSDPDDVRWDCSCGYSGSPEKVRNHWAALHREDGT